MRGSTHLDRTLLVASGWDLVDMSCPFYFLHGLGALGSESLAPALGHREESRMVSSFSLSERNKTPVSFVHHYLFIKYIKFCLNYYNTYSAFI